MNANVTTMTTEDIKNVFGANTLIINIDQFTEKFMNEIGPSPEKNQALQERGYNKLKSRIGGCFGHFASDLENADDINPVIDQLIEYYFNQRYVSYSDPVKNENKIEKLTFDALNNILKEYYKSDGHYIILYTNSLNPLYRYTLSQIGTKMGSIMVPYTNNPSGLLPATMSYEFYRLFGMFIYPITSYHYNDRNKFGAVMNKITAATLKIMLSDAGKDPAVYSDCMYIIRNHYEWNNRNHEYTDNYVQYHYSTLDEVRDAVEKTITKRLDNPRKIKYVPFSTFADSVYSYLLIRPIGDETEFYPEFDKTFNKIIDKYSSTMFFGFTGKEYKELAEWILYCFTTYRIVKQ